MFCCSQINCQSQLITLRTAYESSVDCACVVCFRQTNSRSLCTARQIIGGQATGDARCCHLAQTFSTVAGELKQSAWRLTASPPRTATLTLVHCHCNDVTYCLFHGHAEVVVVVEGGRVFEHARAHRRRRYRSDVSRRHSRDNGRYRIPTVLYW